ncbi:hypothetical protein B0H67DRAFT_369686 [Lasiosphaeris hirsuta]|uniref:Secreted protein n=1 Tax=Lasiosphaeris hirsuta TaxID=260670 RepID=A0AA39ZWS3_9PEZI|nr:hypothetical protein B0H67DRAFT_369686 [Lasiosphaeris hirsuta]
MGHTFFFFFSSLLVCRPSSLGVSVLAPNQALSKSFCSLFSPAGLLQCNALHCSPSPTWCSATQAGLRARFRKT